MYKLNIRKIRISKKITQSKLARDSGLSQSFISDLEKKGWKRVKGCRLETIEMLAKGLQQCPMDLMTYDCRFCVIVLNDRDRLICKRSKYNSFLKLIKIKLNEVDNDLGNLK